VLTAPVALAIRSELPPDGKTADVHSIVSSPSSQVPRRLVNWSACVRQTSVPRKASTATTKTAAPVPPTSTGVAK
jgi:hypothetical protein